MKKRTYRIKTLSSLIVSPRASLAFYKALGQFSLENDGIKVIYPFYQYGEYTKYEPEKAAYYLPGSSIKGALSFPKTHAPKKLMVDDIPVKKENLVLRSLYKLQYLKDMEKARFGVFFENVAVEMVKAQVELAGELYLDGTEEAQVLLEAANLSTRKRIQQMFNYLDTLASALPEEQMAVLVEARNNLSLLLENNKVILFGGYKGLLHSIERSKPSEENNGAIFLDTKTMLPHGLVEMEWT